MNEPVTTDRQQWMAVLARATTAEIRNCLPKAPALPHHKPLRGPEVGLVMMQGRAGGDGANFNFSEVTVTRCAVSLDDGTIGHAYVLGRDHEQAELAAILDAALQSDASRILWLDMVIRPLAEQQASRKSDQAGRAAATKVQFFTMATMR
ncbi:phosphonate C-P lyase system protein PhnG [Pseudoroseomonas globiformis]|uniref:Phosphonate C-P lyase system protein PhnG n=1 Tax=Teichococcus globiformis TaxID=2307229 RepID=A0ABV7FZL0_9PROT